MPVFEVFWRFSPPRSFVTGDTDVTPQSGTFHTANVVLHSPYTEALTSDVNVLTDKKCSEMI
jgi:hypothetical protein